MWKKAIIMCLFATTANAQSVNLSLPGSPGNYQSDKFRTGDLDCSNAIGSATQLEFGVTGIINDDTFNNSSENKDVGVYARITIPIGKVAKERINCNELYQLELKKKRLEVMRLEQELQQLRQLQFEN